MRPVTMCFLVVFAWVVPLKGKLLPCVLLLSLEEAEQGRAIHFFYPFSPLHEKGQPFFGWPDASTRDGSTNLLLLQ